MHSCSGIRWRGCLLGVSAALWLLAARAADFETVAPQPVADVLPADLAAGDGYAVATPVNGDGLMYRFLVESRFGKFGAYGRGALKERIAEVHALRELSRKSSIEIVAGGVGRDLESEVETAAGVVEHPVRIVTGIPRGVAHLFRGYTAKANETLTTVQSAGSAVAGGGGAAGASLDVKATEARATQYADSYLGVTRAERDWYKRLGVDPYTDNTVLRDAVRKAAKLEAAGRTGVKFAGLPALPGIAVTQRAVDAIYNEDPAVLRANLRRKLASYGLGASEIDAWLNARALSPTRQVLLLAAVEQLQGVEGRGELFRHSLDLTSSREAQVYLSSVQLMVIVHRSAPLRAIVPGVRLPTAESRRGELIVCGAFEAVYWTADVAAAAEQLGQSLPPHAAGAQPQIWLLGETSARARAEIAARGWELHEVRGS